MKQVITESSNKKDVAITLRKEEQFDKPFKKNQCSISGLCRVFSLSCDRYR